MHTHVPIASKSHSSACSHRISVFFSCTECTQCALVAEQSLRHSRHFVCCCLCGCWDSAIEPLKWSAPEPDHRSFRRLKSSTFEPAYCLGLSQQLEWGVKAGVELLVNPRRGDADRGDRLSPTKSSNERS